MASPSTDSRPRRAATRFVGLLICAFAAACGGTGEDSEAGRPNVILISLDTLRQDRCGFHGYGRDTTPFLDELASESLVFENARATAPWTLISHMTMFTGLYPAQHKVWAAEAALAESVPTMPELLSDAGAAAVGVHFPGWLDARFGYGRGFLEYRSARDAELAKAQLDEVTRTLEGRWSFLFLHLFDIHSDSLDVDGSLIYDTPAPYDTMFDPEAREVLAGMDAKAVFEAIPEDFTERQREAVRALYDGGIRYLDDRLRAWFAEWTDRGLLDSAIVIITSDHGEGLGYREPGFGGHGQMFEEGLRVPLLVHATPGARRWLEEHRGVAADRLEGRSQALVSHVDLVPTLLDAFDLPASMEYPGASLLREIPGDRWIHAQRRPLWISYRGTDKVRYDKNGGLFGYVDLAADPAGIDELGRRDRPTIERAAALAKEAMAAARALPDPGAAGASGGLSDAERAGLRAIGYGAETERR